MQFDFWGLCLVDTRRKEVTRGLRDIYSSLCTAATSDVESTGSFLDKQYVLGMESAEGLVCCSTSCTLQLQNVHLVQANLHKSFKTFSPIIASF